MLPPRDPALPDLSGAVALVTGGSGGIGSGVAMRLAAAGAAVVVHHRTGTHRAEAVVEAITAGGGRAVTARADLTRPDECATLTAAAVERFGRLDAVVANAGIFIRRPLRRVSLEDWRRVLDINLTSTFLLAQAALRPLRSSKGSIVTIASTRALMSEPNTESYSASKGGLLALTHALAVSLGPDIRVNCVSPGWIATSDYSKLRRKHHAQHPVGRVGKPQDIAEVVAFLLDRDKSGFVTGANFVVDGGMTRKTIYVE